MPTYPSVFSSRAHRIPPALYGLLALAVFGYCLTRVFTVGITFDEAWTMEAFAQYSVSDILRNVPPDANNHLLNTLAVKLSTGLFGESLPAARLPNLLFCAVFLFFAVRICREQIGGAAGLLAFVLLAGNPFLLDFFSLARGYGMAVACELAAVFCAIQALTRKSEAAAYGLFGWSLLAVTASFSLLPVAISGSGWMLGYVGFLLPRRAFFRLVGVYAGLLAGSLLLLVPPLRPLLASGLLYYGGDAGFYQDTILSLVKYSLYRPEADAAAQWTALAATGLTVLLTAVSLRRSRGFASAKMLVLLVLGTAVAGALLQHLLLGTLYPIDRAALGFYPLAALLTALAVADLPLRWRGAVCALILIPVLINLGMKGNFRKTALWYFDSRSRQALEAIESSAAAEQRIVVVDFAWPFSKSVRYAMAHGRFPHLRLALPAGSHTAVNPEADVFIYLNHDLEKLPYQADAQRRLLPPQARVLAEFPEEQVQVLRLR